MADLPGLSLEFVEELALLVYLAVGEEHPPQPGGFLGYPAVRQDVVLDGLVKELLEGRREVLHPLVQLNEEVGLPTFNLAASWTLAAQRL